MKSHVIVIAIVAAILAPTIASASPHRQDQDRAQSQPDYRADDRAVLPLADDCPNANTISVEHCGLSSNGN